MSHSTEFKSEVDENSIPKQSVVICAVSDNRYEDIIDAVHSLNNQAINPDEILICVDSNLHLYQKLLEDFRLKKYINVFIKYNELNIGLANCRNFGLRHSTGEIISYIDDDAIVDSEWSKNLINVFNTTDAVAVAGDVKPLWLCNDPVWFGEELHWIISCNYLGSDKSRGFGTNMSFKRSIIKQIGGFDESLGISPTRWIGGEDTEMFLRLSFNNHHVIYSDSVIVHHKVYSHRINIQNIMKRSYAAGTSFKLIRNRGQKSLSKTEYNYSNYLFKRVYPDLIKRVIRGDVDSLKRLLITTLSMNMIGIGFIFGKMTQETSLE